MFVTQQFFRTVNQRWKNVRIISKYTDIQFKELQKLRDLYSTHILTPQTPAVAEQGDGVTKKLNNSLLATNEAGLPTATTQDLHTRINDRVSYDSPLVAYTNSMVSEIVNYLAVRNQRVWNGDYANDPTNLFSLLLLEWMTRDLVKAGAACNNSLLTEVKQWRKFLLAVRTQHVFSQDESLKLNQTMNALLLQLDTTLEQVESNINYAISRFSIKESLDSMVNWGLSGLDTLFTYLACTINDKAIPLNCSIISLNSPMRSPELMASLSKSQTGLLLIYLASIPEIQELFFPEQFQLNTTLENTSLSNALAIKGKTSTIQQSAWLARVEKKENLYLDGYGKTSEKLLGAITASPQNVSNTPTGVHQAFSGNLTVMRSFLRLHGLVVVFANLLLNMRQAANLSGSTGEIFLCTATKEQLGFLLASHQQVINEIVEELKVVTNASKQYGQKLYGTSAKKEPDQLWLKNHDRSLILHSELEGHFAESNLHRSTAFSVLTNIKNRIETAKRNLHVFVQDVSLLAEQYVWLVPGNTRPQLAYAPSASSNSNRTMLLTYGNTGTPVTSLDLYATSTRKIDNELISLVIDKMNNNPHVVNLDLCRNNISQPGISLLIAGCDLKRLKILKLWRNPLGNSGVGAVAMLLSQETFSLHSVDLNETQFTEEGALVLSQVLSDNKSLVFLDISYNKIGDKGIGYIFEALHNNTTLETLVINGTGLTKLSEKSFLTLLDKNKSLTDVRFSSDNDFTEDQVAKINSAIDRNKSIKQMRK